MEHSPAGRAARSFRTTWAAPARRPRRAKLNTQLRIWILIGIVEARRTWPCERSGGRNIGFEKVAGMYESKSFVYLDLQKTGTSFIVDFLRRFSNEGKGK